MHLSRFPNTRLYPNRSSSMESDDDARGLADARILRPAIGHQISFVQRKERRRDPKEAKRKGWKGWKRAKKAVPISIQRGWALALHHPWRSLLICVLACTPHTYRILYRITYYSLAIIALIILYGFWLTLAERFPWMQSALSRQRFPGLHNVFRDPSEDGLHVPQLAPPEWVRNVDQWRTGLAQHAKEQERFEAPPLVSHEGIQSIIDDMLYFVQRDYIQAWYHNAISRDLGFINSSNQVLHDVVATLVERVVKWDVTQFVTSKALPILTAHISEYRLAERAMKSKLRGGGTQQQVELALVGAYRAGHLHPATSAEAAPTLGLERAYLRQVVAKLLPLLGKTPLARRELDSKIVTTLVREILACKILQPVIEMLSDADFWNKAMELVADKMAVQDQSLVHDIREVLDTQKQAAQGLFSTGRNTMGWSATGGSDEEATFDLPRMQTFDEFIKQIKGCNNLPEALSIRDMILGELSKKQSEISDFRPSDIVHGVRVADTRVYINRLQVALRRVDKRIVGIESRVGRKLSTGSRSPRWRSSGKGEKLQPAPRMSLRAMLEDPMALSFLTEFMDQEGRMGYLQVWVVIDGVYGEFLRMKELAKSRNSPEQFKGTQGDSKFNDSAEETLHVEDLPSADWTSVLDDIRSVTLKCFGPDATSPTLIAFPTGLRNKIDALVTTVQHEVNIDAHGTKSALQTLLAVQNHAFSVMERRDYPKFCSSGLYLQFLASIREGEVSPIRGKGSDDDDRQGRRASNKATDSTDEESRGGQGRGRGRMMSRTATLMDVLKGKARRRVKSLDDGRRRGDDASHNNSSNEVPALPLRTDTTDNMEGELQSILTEGSNTFGVRRSNSQDHKKRPSKGDGKHDPPASETALSPTLGFRAIMKEQKDRFLPSNKSGSAKVDAYTSEKSPSRTSMESANSSVATGATSSPRKLNRFDSFLRKLSSDNLAVLPGKPGNDNKSLRTPSREDLDSECSTSVEGLATKETVADFEGIHNGELLARNEDDLMSSSDENDGFPVIPGTDVAERKVIGSGTPNNIPHDSSKSQAQLHSSDVATTDILNALGSPAHLTAVHARIQRLMREESDVAQHIKQVEREDAPSDRLRELELMRLGLASLLRQAIEEQKKLEEEEMHTFISPERTRVSIDGTRTLLADGKEFSAYIIHVAVYPRSSDSSTIPKESRKSTDTNTSSKTSSSSIATATLTPQRQWVLTRRYSEFLALHRILRVRYPAIQRLDFPKKVIKGILKLKKELVDQRRNGLEAYLKQILQDREVCESMEVRRFLCEEQILAVLVPKYPPLPTGNPPGLSKGKLSLVKSLFQGGEGGFEPAFRRRSGEGSGYVSEEARTPEALARSARASVVTQEMSDEEDGAKSLKSSNDRLALDLSRVSKTVDSPSTATTLPFSPEPLSSTLSVVTSVPTDSESAPRFNTSFEIEPLINPRKGRGLTERLQTAPNLTYHKHSRSVSATPTTNNSQSAPHFTTADSMHDLVVELFDLREKNNWLRRQAVGLVLQQVFGGAVERRVNEWLDWLVGAENVQFYLGFVRETLWPGSDDGTRSRPTTSGSQAAGQAAAALATAAAATAATGMPSTATAAGAAPNPTITVSLPTPSAPAPRTSKDIQRTAQAAHAKILALIPDLLGNMVGRKNAKRGAQRLWSVFQYRRLNQQIAYTLLDAILEEVMPEITSVLGRPSEKASTNNEDDFGSFSQSTVDPHERESFTRRMHPRSFGAALRRMGSGTESGGEKEVGSKSPGGEIKVTGLKRAMSVGARR